MTTPLQVTLTATDQLMVIDGAPCRLWLGTLNDPNGGELAVQAAIVRIAPEAEQYHERFHSIMEQHKFTPPTVLRRGLAIQLTGKEDF